MKLRGNFRVSGFLFIEKEKLGKKEILGEAFPKVMFRNCICSGATEPWLYSMVATLLWMRSTS